MLPLVTVAPACPDCLSGPELVEFGEPLRGELLAEFQRRYRANPLDGELDGILELVETVDRGIQSARVEAHLNGWKPSKHPSAALASG